MANCRGLAIGVAIASAVAGAANAHDLWLQPKAYRLDAPGPVDAAVFVGHAADRQRWGVAIDRVLSLKSVSADGVADQRPFLRPASLSEDFRIRLGTPGVHILTMESGYAESTLPALRFNDYLKAEGLTPALEARARTRTERQPGREIYSRRAKALIAVGDGLAPQPHVTRPVGLTLEIVPKLNPFQLGRNQNLPIQVLFEGKPLPGALVKLTNLDDDKLPVEAHRTDAAGNAMFKRRTGGKWLLNVLWTKPLKGGGEADFDTTFSSLTFSFPT